MHCKLCGEFFQPTPDEERLIVSGSVEEICTPCATRKWKEKSDREFKATPIYPRTAIGGDGTTLCRAEWYTEKGRLIAFVSMPLLRPQYDIEPLRPNKVTDIHVFVFTNDSRANNRRPTEPPMTMHTNLDTFQKTRAKTFWVRKVPDCADQLTGVGSIEFDARRVKRIDRNAGVVEITLTDDSCVRMFYR